MITELQEQLNTLEKQIRATNILEKAIDTPVSPSVRVVVDGNELDLGGDPYRLCQILKDYLDIAKGRTKSNMIQQLKPSVIEEYKSNETEQR